MAGYMLRPFQGAAYDFHGAEAVIKASSQDTAGQLAVMEFVYPPGLVVHSHVHAGEDEMFLLLAGEMSAFCGHERWTVVPGCFVFVPRDVPHGFTVTSATEARSVVITGPPRLDQQVAGYPQLRPE
ncbi:MAG TPA: cupin domain-containing protein [Streptosporangiaceae bacterium]